MSKTSPAPIPTRGRVDSEVGVSDTADQNSYDDYQLPLQVPNMTRSTSNVNIAPQASASENPQPQIAQAPNPTQSGTNGDKLVIVMVGLPARGKTYIARKIAHYFRFFHGAPAEVYNVGNYRRQISGAQQSADFFDVKNDDAMVARQQAAEAAMGALKEFICKGNEVGRVGIYDATNTTRDRRSWILEELKSVVHSKSHVVFVEIICTDDSVIDNNIRAVKTTMPDYQGQDPEEAVRDFRERIANYKSVYQPLEDETLSFIKLYVSTCYVTVKDNNTTVIKSFNVFILIATHGCVPPAPLLFSMSYCLIVLLSYCLIVSLCVFRYDEGRKVTANNIRGSLQSTVLQFMLSLHNTPRPIYLSRHGQSQYNVLGKVGGDSDLSGAGEEYATSLADFARENILDLSSVGEHLLPRCNPKHTRLWTSSLRRTINTARHISHNVQENDGWVTMRPRVWNNLDELYAGIFDGLTYDEIRSRAPEEFAQRQQNKLSYRYPRGESYLDVIARLDQLIHELERQHDPVLIVAHQGILRIVYAYMMGVEREKAPFVKIPLNTVIKLVPGAYGCREERICLIPGAVASQEQPSH